MNGPKSVKEVSDDSGNPQPPSFVKGREVAIILDDVETELRHACRIWPPMNSHHEAYAVILEELTEYWNEVMKKEARRDSAAMYFELKQVAAMACRAMLNLSLGTNDA